MSESVEPASTAPIWPVGRYAPGWYFCRCLTCKESFDGDKHSITCPKCTIQELVKKIKDLEETPAHKQAVLPSKLSKQEIGRLVSFLTKVVEEFQ